MRLFVLDNTLGYCSGRQSHSFNMNDKLAIARELDRVGIHYIDAGCPAEDRKAREFLSLAGADPNLTHARLVASAHIEAIRHGLEEDTAIEILLGVGTPAVALSCGCSHDGPDGLQEYCAAISEIVRHLKGHTREVIFRAEDFFDSYCAGPGWTLTILEAAKTAGADILCLCDSAGNALPQPLREICAEVRKRFDGILGICAHDDSDLAVANTLEAVEQGFTFIAGSVNPYGPRSGSVNLCSAITNLESKLGHTVLGAENLAKIDGVARLVAEAAAAPLHRAPQGGGPLRLELETEPEEALLERVDAQLLEKLTDAGRRSLLDRIRLVEFDGYELRTAGGTLELLVRESLYPELRPFQAECYEVTSHSAPDGAALSTATVTIRVGEHVRCESEEGVGPVNALDRCLRQCLFVLYPEISNIEVTDYRAQVLEHSRGTGARVRVSLEWCEGSSRWTTAGVSDNLLQAFWQALIDGFLLPLMRRGESAPALVPLAADSSWAV